MLHVFAVNRGQMLTFDVALAMERVIDLKKAVSSSSKIVRDKQVMLINGGQALDDNAKVCTYAAGTETNPIYVFDKSMIEQSSIQQKHKHDNNNGFSSEIQSALVMPPCYATLVSRTQLALKIHEATRHQVATIKTLVHDEHLMFQGWQAAIANLSDTLHGFEQRIVTMHEQCSAMLQESLNHEEILNGLDEIIEVLSHIPLLPSLLKTGDHVPAAGLSLLDWIEGKCRNVKLGNMLKECQQRVAQLKQDKLDLLVQDCKRVSEQANNTRMRDITGIGDRLVALDHVIVAAQQQVKEQRGIAQGFVKNQETARELQEGSMNHDALLTLCESHVTQLQIMRGNELATREAMVKCDSAKSELAQNLHTRLRWLYFVQRSILNADVKLSMFREQLMQLHHQVEFLSQVKKAPDFYFSSLTECVRRKSFCQLFTQWTDGLLTASRMARDREIIHRKTFKAKTSNHFMQKLFPGFSDKPPSIAKRPLKRFDLDLPNVSNTDLQFLTNKFPQFKQPEFQVEPLPDPTQLSWQLVYSTSTKTSLTLQSSDACITSQNQSVTSSVNSTTSFIEETGEKSSDDLYNNVEMKSNFSPGGFVMSSVRKVIDDEMDENEPLKNFSPPHLLTPPPGDMLEIGSPDSGEFFSIQPFTGTSPKLQSFVTISPPRKGGFASDMFPIPENELATSIKDGSVFIKMGSQSQLTSSTSDDEMFHSFTNDLEKDKILSKIKELEIEKETKEEEFRRLIKKYEENVASLQRSRDEVVSDFDRRWAESRVELENVIGQLESEQKERKQAWEKESLMTKQLEELGEKYSHLVEENTKVQFELTSKIQLMSEMDSEMKKRTNAIEIEITHVREEAEREVWEAKQMYEAESEKLKKTVDNLEKALEHRNSEIDSAEDRIQELETQLSEAEAKISAIECSVETSAAEVELCHKDVEKHKACQEQVQLDLQAAKDHVSKVEVQLAKTEEKSDSLKTMLAAYEVELENMRETNELLRESRSELRDVKSKNEKLQNDLSVSEKTRQRQETDLLSLNSQLNEHKTTMNEQEIALNNRIEELRSDHEKIVLEVKQEAEDRGKIIFESNKRKMETQKEEHSHELIRISEANEVAIEDIRKTNRCELDEMEADRLEAIVSIQQQYDELREQYNRQADSHQLKLDELKSNHQNDKDRLVKELERSTLENSELQSKLSQYCTLQSLRESMLTSSVMSSSNEEMESKRTRMDDEMMMSYKAELEKEKEAMKSSFKKKEEDATRRRQMVFNSAIQRVTSAKDAEIERLKQQLTKQSMLLSVEPQSPDINQSMASSTRLKDREKVTVSNFQRDDNVLVTYDPQHSYHVIVALGHAHTHFLHTDSINELSLKPPDASDPGDKFLMLAKFVEKEYCQARKANNRFKVDVGTKFYRVKVAAMSKTPS